MDCCMLENKTEIAKKIFLIICQDFFETIVTVEKGVEKSSKHHQKKFKLWMSPTKDGEVKIIETSSR